MSGELGDFPPSTDEEPPDEQEPEQEQEQTDPLPADRYGPRSNPLGLDARVGVHDLCFDRAKPGARVYVVRLLGESIQDYEERFPDAPALDDYEGNVICRFDPEDRVFAAVYVKDSLTSTNFTAYPMPESRLTRFPAEEAELIGNGSVEFNRTPLREVESSPGEEAREDPDRREVRK